MTCLKSLNLMDKPRHSELVKEIAKAHNFTYEEMEEIKGKDK